MQELGEGDTLTDSFLVTVTDEDGLTDTVHGEPHDHRQRRRAGDHGGQRQRRRWPRTRPSAGGDRQSRLDRRRRRRRRRPGRRAAATYGTAAIDPATGEWTYTLDNALTRGAGAGRGRHAHRQLPGDGDRRGRSDRHGDGDHHDHRQRRRAGDHGGQRHAATWARTRRRVAAAATGNLDSTDVDVGDTPTWIGGRAATYGTASIDPATGEWTYTLNNALTRGAGAGRGRHAHRQLPGDGDRRGRSDRHGDGEPHDHRRRRRAGDHGGQRQGDGGRGRGCVPLVATGNLDSTDVDVGDDADLDRRAPATYGTASIDPATGEWTYTLNNALTAVQELGEGDTLTDSFLVTVTDEDGLDRHGDGEHHDHRRRRRAGDQRRATTRRRGRGRLAFPLVATGNLDFDRRRRRRHADLVGGQRRPTARRRSTR